MKFDHRRVLISLHWSFGRLFATTMHNAKENRILHSTTRKNSFFKLFIWVVQIVFNFHLISPCSSIYIVDAISRVIRRRLGWCVLLFSTISLRCLNGYSELRFIYWYNGSKWMKRATQKVWLIKFVIKNREKLDFFSFGFLLH